MSTSSPRSTRRTCRSSSAPCEPSPSAPGSTSTADRPAPGRLYAGTSGFAYPGWSPRFYPAGLRGDGLLRHFATRLGAVELNNTFYQQPSATKVAAWLDATPATFRFSVKAQRGGSWGPELALELTAAVATRGGPVPG